MGRIKDIDKYPYDNNVTSSDYVVGSDSDTNGKTKSFKMSDMAAYFTQYFNSQNQSISLVGNVTGGNGVAIVPTTAHPSLISDKPVATELEAGGKFLYLKDGALNQIDAQVIIDSGGSYTPPTYPPLNFGGGGLEFMSHLETNNLGAITGGAMGFVQDATTAQKGVIRIAQPSEYNSNSTTIALPPAAMSTFLPTSAISGGVPFFFFFVGTNQIGNSIVQENGNGIGIGVSAVEKLTVGGIAQADGFKSPANSDATVLTSNGGEATGTEDIRVSGGHIELVPLNLFTGDGDYVIPSVKNKMIYVTYDGQNISGGDSVTLPVNPVSGQTVHIFHESENSTGTLIVYSPTTFFEFDMFTAFVCYYNGNRWMIFPRVNLNIG